MSVPVDDYLAPGYFVNSDAPQVWSFAEAAVGDETDQVTQAVGLFDAVRDRIWYDPFNLSQQPGDYRASAVATSPSNWCVPKAVLLAAAARAVGIRARLGFADVRNHLQTPRLRERMGGADLFVFHGYTELYLDQQWVKATPAFNAELCARFGVAPMDFDGRSDALLHEYTADGGEYMEYVRDRGVYTDLPLDEIISVFHDTYGPSMFAAANGGADEFTRPVA